MNSVRCNGLDLQLPTVKCHLAMIAASERRLHQAYRALCMMISGETDVDIHQSMRITDPLFHTQASLQADPHGAYIIITCRGN